MSLSPEVLERVKKLEEKYAIMGQDMKSYMDGLLYADPITYWDYIKIDTLLNLQQPRTSFPDEMIFILYHQVTELYFKMIILELKQIAHGGRDVTIEGEDRGWKDDLTAEYFIERLKRVNAHFRALTSSYEVMVDGMEKDQFMRFRMALLPASGFQSVQYRGIEIICTDLVNIIDQKKRNKFLGFPTDSSVEQMFDFVYWKQGATELDSGKKTLTLKLFEKKYSEELIELAKEYKNKNLWRKYIGNNDFKDNKEISEQLRLLDLNININWSLAHYKSAVKYLGQDKDAVASTGGTNWQKYLPPRYQKRIFFPELWSDQEKEEWGKQWVDTTIANG